MESFSAEQRKTLSDFFANIAVIWFGGGIAAPILAGQELLQTIRPGIWGVSLAALFLAAALWVNKK